MNKIYESSVMCGDVKCFLSSQENTEIKKNSQVDSVQKKR